VATQGYTLDKADDRTRMTVECPGGKEPYGGGFLTSPPPGDDGQGIYPNSYERLGQQRGYHITAALINPNRTAVVPRNLTLQVICGKKIGPISDPHVIQQLSAGMGRGPWSRSARRSSRSSAAAISGRTASPTRG
jgi:hypothetical protein